MNNEEKILQILTELQAGQAKLQAEQVELRADLGKLNQNVAKIEVEHGRKLDALVDGYRDVDRKVDALKITVDDIAGTVSALDVLHKIQPHP